MHTVDLLNDFIIKSFSQDGIRYKLAFTPELLPVPMGLDFTGNFIGVFISESTGTHDFQVQQHPEKIWKFENNLFDVDPQDFPYKFTMQNFKYRGELYRAVITPELFSEGNSEGLEFTGCYLGILSSAKTGTVNFQLCPIGDHSWDCEEGNLEPGVIDELDKIIQGIRSNFPVSK